MLSEYVDTPVSNEGSWAPTPLTRQL